MTVLQMKYFMEAAQCRNISDAARTLYVAQPAVTKHIVELEKELEFQLFVREARGVKLTKQGELMYAALQRCKEDFESALDKARKISAGDSKLAIGLQSMVELYAISAKINAFRTQHQNAKIEFRRLSLFDIYPALENHDIDLAIVFDKSIPEKSNIAFFRLIQANDFILTAKDSPLAAKSSVGPEDLQDLHIVQERPKNNVYSSAFGPPSELCSKLGFQEKNIIWCDNFESCLTTVEHCGGVMIIDEFTVFPNKENFCYINTGSGHHVSIAWSIDKLPPLAAEMAQWLKSSLT
jgi:LysR family transcriptional activator of glutamate synthase operon